MTNKPLVLHRLARNEASAAVRWYTKRNPAVANRFNAELERTLGSIERNPYLFPPHLLGTRRRVLRRFPYLVIYVEIPTAWLVVADAHGKRRPGYWRRRLNRP